MRRSASRASRCFAASLGVAAYFAAAVTPCAPAPESGIRTAALAARAMAVHAAHRVHGDHREGGESRGGAESLAQVGTSAAIAAPCVCGCGKRAGTASTSRLGPVVLTDPLAIAAKVAPAPAVVRVRNADSIAQAPPDPVPIASLA